MIFFVLIGVFSLAFGGIDVTAFGGNVKKVSGVKSKAIDFSCHGKNCKNPDPAKALKILSEMGDIKVNVVGPDANVEEISDSVFVGIDFGSFGGSEAEEDNSKEDGLIDLDFDKQIVSFMIYTRQGERTVIYDNGIITNLTPVICISGHDNDFNLATGSVIINNGGDVLVKNGGAVIDDYIREVSTTNGDITIHGNAIYAKTKIGNIIMHGNINDSSTLYPRAALNQITSFYNKYYDEDYCDVVTDIDNEIVELGIHIKEGFYETWQIRDLDHKVVILGEKNDVTLDNGHARIYRANEVHVRNGDIKTGRSVRRAGTERGDIELHGLAFKAKTVIGQIIDPSVQPY